MKRQPVEAADVNEKTRNGEAAAVAAGNVDDDGEDDGVESAVGDDAEDDGRDDDDGDDEVDGEEFDEDGEVLYCMGCCTSPLARGNRMMFCIRGAERQRL